MARLQFAIAFALAETLRKVFTSKRLPLHFQRQLLRLPALVFTIWTAEIPLATAQIYRFEDESGKSHYTSDLERVPERFRSTAKVPHTLPRITKSAPAVVDVGRAPKQSTMRHETGLQGRPVTIYVTSWCPYCRELEQFLKQNGVRYRRLDIERSREGQRLYRGLGGGGVPVVQIGGQVFRGFDEAELRHALRLR